MHDMLSAGLLGRDQKAVLYYKRTTGRLNSIFLSFNTLKTYSVLTLDAVLCGVFFISYALSGPDLLMITRGKSLYLKSRALLTGNPIVFLEIP